MPNISLWQERAHTPGYLVVLLVDINRDEPTVAAQRERVYHHGVPRCARGRLRAEGRAEIKGPFPIVIVPRSAAT